MRDRSSARAFRQVTAVAVFLSVMTLPAGAKTRSLPAGFAADRIDSGQGAYQLTDVAPLADGSLLTTGKSGLITHVATDGTITEVGRLPVYEGVDTGLLGLALDVDHATTSEIYVVHTPLGYWPPENHLSLVVLDDPLAPTGIVAVEPVVAGIVLGQLLHIHGEVQVAPDGSIFFGHGDNAEGTFASAESLRSQALDEPYGKIMRVLPDGSGHPGNPFYEPAAPDSWRSRVFAYGLRNPFRFILSPDPTVLYVGDVGWISREEVSVIRAGDNGGWPCWEGSVQTPGFREMPECQALYASLGADPPVPPVWEYPRDLPPGDGASITGGDILRGDHLPTPYDGAYVFGDYVKQVLWTMVVDGEHELSRPPEPVDPGATRDEFASGLGAPVAIVSAPGGLLYLADIVSGDVIRLRYESSQAGNHQPIADRTWSLGPDGRTLTLDATSSSDPDGDPLTFRWDPGDGGALLEGPTVQHTFSGEGSFRVTLTVTDDRGFSDRSAFTITIEDEPPQLSLVTPPPGRTYAAGEIVEVHASAGDREDGPLPGSAIRWTVLLHHCSLSDDGCHVHPQDAGTGATYRAAFTEHGDHTSVEVIAEVSDSRGQVATASYVADPRLRSLTAVSDPPGADLDVSGHPPEDGLAITAGTRVSVAAPAEHLGGPFAGWSDGGARLHTFAMPDTDLHLVARYDVTEATAADLPGVQVAALDRVAGETRIGTALGLSQRLTSADAVVLARADLYPDAVAGAPLAAGVEAPLLLTGGDALDPAVAEEVVRLGARTAYILGGPAALSQRVATDLSAAGVQRVVRLGGVDRFDTARLIASQLGGDRAYLVEGADPDPARGWPDAVAVSALATHTRAAVLLATTDVLPDATASALASRRHVTIVGGDHAVGPPVEVAVRARVTTVDRLAGADRYGTSLAVADAGLEAGMNGDEVWLATGRDWGDALAAAPLAALSGDTLLLIDGTDLRGAEATLRWLADRAATITGVTVIGGAHSISAEVADAARTAVST